ncbi:hypothetical protein QVD99_008013 [Batrachochytrium dendrobatidis]|nr:hypothetical protein O5D80_004833 [Batrachochytrium dendrobatidis]KAK5665165.1 hypothetical protein QVD99_008013 [Batrachochytrium dendrobatidis]
MESLSGEDEYPSLPSPICSINDHSCDIEDGEIQEVDLDSSLTKMEMACITDNTQPSLALSKRTKRKRKRQAASSSPKHTPPARKKASAMIKNPTVARSNMQKSVSCNPAPMQPTCLNQSNEISAPDPIVHKASSDPTIGSALAAVFGISSFESLPYIHPSLSFNPEPSTTDSTTACIPLQALPAEPQRIRNVYNKPKKPCVFWANNKCKQGSQCTFSHDGPGSDARSKQVCRHFKTNSCINGSQCPFSHTLKDAPCVFFHFKQLNGGCLQGEQCPYSHLPITADQQAVLDKEQARWDNYVKNK